MSDGNGRISRDADTLPILQAQGLTLQRGDRVLCRDLSFAVMPKTCWVILGPNGGGKSTLLSTLGGFLPPQQGSVSWNGKPLTALDGQERARFRAFLGVQPGDVFSTTVFETVLAGRHPYATAWQWESAQDIDAAQQALQCFKLEALAARDIRTLSAGERQRVALAALLAQAPQLYLLDEPASHLDPAQQVEALDTLLDVAQASGAAVVMVLHELHLATRYADNVVLLGEGKAKAGVAGEWMTADKMSSLFGVEMVKVGNEMLTSFIPALTASASLD